MTTTNDNLRNDPLLYEVFVQWPAWQVYAEHYGMVGETPATADPFTVFRRFCESEDEQKTTRLAALLWGRSCAESLEEGKVLAGELLIMSSEGRRPRYGAEVGLKPFGEREAS